MIVALYVIAILWIAAGVSLILYTEKTMGIIKKLFFIENVRALAAIPFLFGIVLVLGSFFYKKIFWLSLVLGVLSLAKAVYLFLGPSSQIKSLMGWWFNSASSSMIRLWGLIAFILGVALFANL